MKPDNVNPPFMLPDNEPALCHFMARADAPIFWERCEQWATKELEVDVIDEFNAWKERNPNGILALYPGRLYVCDTHADVIEEIISYGM